MTECNCYACRRSAILRAAFEGKFLKPEGSIKIEGNLHDENLISTNPFAGVQVPLSGSRWKHTNDNEYVVEFITNEKTKNPDKYPASVIYRNASNGTLWSRALDDWHRSMTEIPTDSAAPEGTQDAEIPEVGSRWYYKGRRNSPVNVMRASEKGVTYQHEASLWFNRTRLHLWHESFTREPLSHVEPVDDAVEAPAEGTYWTRQSNKRVYEVRGHADDHVWCVEVGQETGLWFPVGNWHERFLRVADSFLERALSSSSKFPEPGYERLHAVFRDAHDQAAIGKGDERHANNLPFDEQRMQTISQGLGSPDGMAYQVIKKIQEGLQMNDHARTRAELLGALNYLAGIVIFLDDKQHAAEQREAGHDGTD